MHKKSRLTKNTGSSKPEVFLAIQGMKKYYNSGQLSLLCIATHMPFAHTSDKNYWRIFLMPVPSKKVFTYGNNLGHGFGLTAEFSGCRDRHYKIAVVVRGWFCGRGAFQAMQK